MGGTTSRLAAPHEVPLATKEIERDVEAGQQYADDAFWVVLFPGLAIVMAALSLQLIGDGLRDMLDPKLRKAL